MPFLIFLMFGFISQTTAQMNIDGQSLFGHEWMRSDQDYYKIKLSETGIYRVGYQQLKNAGIPIDGINGSEIQLFNLGKEQFINVSNDGSFGSNDYIEFHGEINNGELEKHLFSDWNEEQLNEMHSMFTDENVYFFTWNAGSSGNKRYADYDNDLSGNLPPVEEFYMHEEMVIESGELNNPDLDRDHVRYSHFLTGEGYGTGLAVVNSVEIQADNIYADGDSPYLIATVASNYITNNFDANPFHKFEISFNGYIKENDQFNGLSLRRYNLPLSISELENNNEFFVKGRGSSNGLQDKNTIGFVNLVYPREFNASGKDFYQIKVNADSRKYFEIENFNSSSQVYVYDLTQGLRYRAEVSSGILRFTLPQGSAESDLIIMDASALLSDNVEIEKGSSFIDFTQVDPQLLILTSRELNAGPSVSAYAEFKETELGGDLEAFVVEYEQLRDQFGYGIEGNPRSIMNFSQFVKDKWERNEFAFIIGKALEYSVLRRGNQSPYTSHVPTVGVPGSDNLLFAENDVNFPFWGVGRLAANTEEDVANYLDKIMAFEAAKVAPQTIQDKEWMKKIIHLAGGTGDLADRLFGHLNDMKDIIEESTMAADVKTFQKVSNSPTQNPLSTDILGEVNKGASIMTFFGHSSAGTFDFSIEDPSQYDNGPRMPLVISLGCHSGNIHAPIFAPQGISESFVLQPNHGAIAFLASSGAAYVDPQYKGGISLYSKFGESNYGKAIGTSIKETLEDNFNAASDFLKYRTTSLTEQLTLHGDPSLILPSSEGPDYIVDFETFGTEPSIVSTNLDSFEVNFEVVNLGKKNVGFLQGLIIHKYGNEADTTSFSINEPARRQMVSKKLVTQGINSLGKNIIEVILDPNNSIAELPDPDAENNNSINAAYGEEGYCFFVFDNNARPVYPSEFSIVNEQDIRLVASSSNALIADQEYIIEIDTTDLFNSPLKETTKLISGAGMIDWTPSLSYQDGTVYYWRIAFVDDANPDLIGWESSSFIYLPSSSEGWNQSHFYQWQKDNFETAQINENTRNFEFADDLKSINITNGVFPEVHPILTYQSEPNSFIEWDGPVNEGIWIFVFDEFSGEPWKNPFPGTYGSTMNTSWADNFIAFPYWTRTSDERAIPVDFLENTIPDRSYVVVMSIQADGKDYLPGEWGSDPGMNLKNYLEGQGASRLDELGNSGSVPYVFAFRKNDPNWNTIERIGDLNSPLQINFDIPAKWFEGAVISDPIGPASDWESLEFDLQNFEDSDTVNISIIGIDENDNEVVLFEDITDENFDLSGISADQYPYLKLSFYAYDPEKRSSPYLDFWRVNYAELPDALLNTNENFVFQGDTIARGTDLILRAMIENVQDADMDSLLVKYTLVDISNSEEIIEERMQPLQGLSQIPLEFKRATNDLAGLYEFRVELNAGKEQKEKFFFNNLGVLRFFVREDGVNPLLDLTFDGVHIMNGDIVSPSPMIAITLRDEGNILLNNPEDFEVILEYPDGTLESIDVNGPLVNFLPSSDPVDNKAILEFTPTLITGEYIIYVQAKDPGGNFSGDQDLSVAFRVIAESQISEVLNYPNPFSTSTQFVFTLTGSVIPEDFHIKIMTLSGKVVREITQAELGPINIGVNRTSFKFDGTDEFGKRLANGVYLYKAFSSFDRMSNAEYKVESVDGFFKKGYGKMVIMR